MARSSFWQCNKLLFTLQEAAFDCTACTHWHDYSQQISLQFCDFHCQDGKKMIFFVALAAVFCRLEMKNSQKTLDSFLRILCTARSKIVRIMDTM